MRQDAASLDLGVQGSCRVQAIKSRYLDAYLPGKIGCKSQGRGRAIESQRGTTVALVERKQELSPLGTPNQQASSYFRWTCNVVAACSKTAMVRSWVRPRRRL